MVEVLTTDLQKNSPKSVAVSLLQRTWLKPLCVGLITIGIASRVAPLFDPHGRLLQQFVSEDGYYMQTVARNLALGHGLAVSDGTVQTNGVQPLATFLFALCHYLAGGDKIGGIAGVTILSLFVSVAATWVFYKLLQKLLANHPDGPALSILTASFWFASPTIVQHSMNGLETGLYLLVSLSTLSLVASFVEQNDNAWSIKQTICLGIMLGICFLTRNDAAFFIAAILLARLLLWWPTNATMWQQRIQEVMIPGLISIAIALPWLIYDYRLFGSIVPISGISESLGARFGGNLVQVPAALFAFVTLILPVPHTLRTGSPILLLSLLALAIALSVSFRVLWRQSKAAPIVLLAYGIFGTLLIAFYGLYFGAPYFISRYLAVLSPICALIGITAVYRALQWLRADTRQIALVSSATLGALLILMLNVRVYRHGLEHEHFQVVDWVSANVRPQTWVAAAQSGTLGYFHDRTINLDGKVDPEALRTRLSEGGVIPYVVANKKIQYIADWVGFAGWSRIDKAGFNQRFELIVNDTKHNLAVFRRIDRQPSSAEGRDGN
jgi:hypothetical protein